MAAPAQSSRGRFAALMLEECSVFESRASASPGPCTHGTSDRTLVQGISPRLLLAASLHRPCGATHPPDPSPDLALHPGRRRASFGDKGRVVATLVLGASLFGRQLAPVHCTDLRRLKGTILRHAGRVAGDQGGDSIAATKLSSELPIGGVHRSSGAYLVR